MKTAAEVFKCVLSDGGFKVFAAKCGHKGDVSQWQDMHNILLASYEVLLKSAIQEFRTARREEKQEDFWTWIKELSSSNDDEIQAFSGPPEPVRLVRQKPDHFFYTHRYMV